MYFTGNDIRYDPSTISDMVSSSTKTWLDGLDSNLNYKWSAGLARACWDVVTSLGPIGATGHFDLQGRNQDERVKGYTDSYDEIAEVLVINEIDDDAVPETEALELFAYMADGDSTEREYHFSADYTHIGISCGCHAKEGDFCCIGYGTNVVDKPSTTTPDVTMVDKMSCEESTKWSNCLLYTSPSPRD